MGSGGGGAAGLEGDETRSVALASLPRQLISASCWRLAGRKCTPGGLALESCCSTSTEISDLRTGFIFFWLLTLTLAFSLLERQAKENMCYRLIIDL